MRVIASVTCTRLSRVCSTHVVGRISRSRDWDRMVRLWAGSLGRVSDRETKYLEDDRCHRSFRLHYREPYLSWLERRCGYSFHRLFHWIINTRRADSFDVFRSQRSCQIRRPVGRFSVAKIRHIKWKIVNASRVEGKGRRKYHDAIYYQPRWLSVLFIANFPTKYLYI